MNTDSKLMQMLVEYASAHRNPLNIAVHLIGIPTIMFGVFILLSWLNFSVAGFTINVAYVVAVIFFLFYLTIDTAFSIAFLLAALLIAWAASLVHQQSGSLPLIIAIMSISGGYIAQFIGHAIERSVPVLVTRPIQAHLAAPLFTVVELFKIAGLRSDLFDAVEKELSARTVNPVT